MLSNYIFLALRKVLICRQSHEHLSSFACVPRRGFLTQFEAFLLVLSSSYCSSTLPREQLPSSPHQEE